MANPVMQFQILSKAPNETAKFYSALFGWAVSDNNSLGYREINTGSNEGIQGGIWPAPPQASTFVQLFMAVEDVKTHVKNAEDLGAKLIIPLTVLPNGDELAVMHDSQGMPFGIMKTK
jgi:predicted enzyme related to lactoylglutathione lyase